MPKLFGIKSKIIDLLKGSNSNKKCDAKDRSQCQAFRDRHRLVIFKDHDAKGRAVIFDSAVNESKEHQPGKCRQRLQDTRLLGEMMFGSALMTQKVSTLKIHLMKNPLQLLVTKVFVPVRHSCESSGEHESFDIYSVQSLHDDNASSLPVAINSASDKSFIASSMPINVPLPTFSQSSTQPQWDDSGFSMSVSSSMSSLGPNVSSPGSSVSSSYSSRSRRMQRFQATQLDSLGNSMNLDQNEPIPLAKRPVKIGVGVIFMLDDESLEDNERFLNFFFSHIMIIESYVHKLKDNIDKALAARSRSLSQQAFDEFFKSVYLLYSAPRISEPVWLSMMTCTPRRTLLCSQFLNDLMYFVEKFDTKSTNFFLSGLITGVLTHHLSWIHTVAPVGDNLTTTYLDKHTAKWLNSLGRSHPYNPLWAQLGDLYGAIGFPRRLSRTVVVGAKDQQVVRRLLNVLSYFIRCSEIIENTEPFPKLTPTIPSPTDSVATILDYCSNRASSADITVGQRSTESCECGQSVRGGTPVPCSSRTDRGRFSDCASSFTDLTVDTTSADSCQCRPLVPADTSAVQYKTGRGVHFSVTSSVENGLLRNGFSSETCSQLTKNCCYKPLSDSGNEQERDRVVVVPSDCASQLKPSSVLLDKCDNAAVNGCGENRVANEAVFTFEPTATTHLSPAVSAAAIPVLLNESHHQQQQSEKLDSNVPQTSDERPTLCRLASKQPDENVRIERILAGGREAVTSERSLSPSSDVVVVLPAKSSGTVLGPSIGERSRDAGEKRPTDGSCARLQPVNGNVLPSHIAFPIQRGNSMYDEYYEDGDPEKIPGLPDLVGTANPYGYDAAATFNDVIMTTPCPDVSHIQVDKSLLLKQTAAPHSPSSGFVSDSGESQASDVTQTPVAGLGQDPVSFFDEHFALGSEQLVDVPEGPSKRMICSTIELVQDICADMSSQQSEEETDRIDYMKQWASQPAVRPTRLARHRNPSGQSSSGSVYRSVTPTEHGRLHRSSTTSSDTTCVDCTDHLIELPMLPCDFDCCESPDESFSCSSHESNLGRSLLADYCESYQSDFVLHGTGDRSFLNGSLHRDLKVALKDSVLDEPIDEASCIVADVDKCVVQLYSCKYNQLDEMKVQPLISSQLVASMLESAHEFHKMNVSPEFCLMHLEDQLQSIYVKSRLLAEFINVHRGIYSHDLMALHGFDLSDMPLLLAVACTHNPHLLLYLSNMSSNCNACC